MKQLKKIIGLGFLAILLIKCSKPVGKTPVSAFLQGEWELRQTSAAMNPLVDNYPPGNGKILKFTDSRYTLYDGSQVVKEGEYAVVEDPTVSTSVCLEFPSDQFAQRVIYDNDTTVEKQFFQITGNKLSIVAGCYAIDAGHRSDYERINSRNDN